MYFDEKLFGKFLVFFVFAGGIKHKFIDLNGAIFLKEKTVDPTGKHLLSERLKRDLLREKAIIDELDKHISLHFGLFHVEFNQSLNFEGLRFDVSLRR